VRLRIHLAGDVAIVAGERHVRQERLPGLQGRTVFAMLAAEHDRAVSRDEIEAELWPDDVPAAPETALRAIVSKLRGVLADAGLAGGTLAHAFGAYRLHLPPDAWVDVLAAVEAVHRAEPAIRARDLASAVGWGRAAATIAARPFLLGAQGPWTGGWRDRLRDVRVRALDVLATAWIEVGDPEQAARDAHAAVAMEPYRESSHRLLLRALDASGNRAEALRAYERLRERLADELGVDPGPEIQAVYLEILRSDERSTRRRVGGQ
jgi:DNA-binding SARP family transcriptional activator